MQRSFKIGMVLAVVSTLAGCGLRGPLLMPKEDLLPQSADVVETAPAESGQGKAAGAAPKPHKGFILDDLIR